jgi:GMP synthase-like glutamine amidotransferase
MEDASGTSRGKIGSLCAGHSGPKLIYFSGVMHIHSFHHAPSEGLGAIATWAQRKGHTLSATHFYRGELPPSLDDVDWLIVMGGPMNIYEHRNHPWLLPEKEAIGRAIEQKKRLLGICLGSQLIADVLGGKVAQNPEVEIGWFPIQVDPTAAPAFAGFPAELTPLHWHGDTFTIPPGAVHVASSAACRNQAFAFGTRIVGLQFHPEVESSDVKDFVQAEGDLGKGKFIQNSTAIIQSASRYFPAIHTALESLLDAIEAA